MGPSQGDKSLLSRGHPVLPTISGGYPEPRGRYPCLTAPYAGSLPCGRFPRLACLIHAANVRSEPGSNPSKVYRHPLAGVTLRLNPAASQPNSTTTNLFAEVEPAAQRPYPTPTNSFPPDLSTTDTGRRL